MIKHILACVLSLGALYSLQAGAAVPSSWKATGFSINADGMTLNKVLQEFGKAYGVKLDVQVRAGHKVAGRLQADGGAAFLDRLAAGHHFTWFVYNGTLHVVPLDDTRSVRIEVGEDAVQDAKAALQGLGLFDPRFGWGELPDEGVVLVSGPREYVRLAGEILLPGGKKKEQGQERQMMLFRLKYASATDRVVNVRGNRETLPGLKTILSNLLNPAAGERLAGPAPAPGYEAASRKRSRTGPQGPGQTRELGFAAGAEALRAALPLPSVAGAQGLGAPDGADSDDVDTAATNGGRRQPRQAPREERARIEADPALNAILIYDNVAKRESYQRLIDDLDVEPAQVEIEALIVDIDRTRLADLGVEWSLAIGNTNLTVNGGAGDSAGVALPLPGSTLLIRNAARFYARLKALEGTGEARVLAKPTVLTLENVAAVLDLSQTAYVPLVGERVSDLADITAGTMLRVVPRILREGGRTGKEGRDGKEGAVRVRLDIDIEDGGLTEVGGKTNANRATITTQAMIELQQTLMIGGYHSEQTKREQNKVPLLGDLAGIGGLFRNQSETRRDRERLFLITPRLAQGGTAAPRRSAAARSALLMVDTPSLQVEPAAANQQDEGAAPRQ